MTDPEIITRLDRIIELLEQLVAPKGESEVFVLPTHTPEVRAAMRAAMENEMRSPYVYIDGKLGIAMSHDGLTLGNTEIDYCTKDENKP